MWFFCYVAFAIFIWALFCFVTRGKCTSSVCLVGKTAIVTGGNSGIGYQTCLNLASRGCKVIIADVDRSDEPRKNIIQETNNPNVVLKFLDLASFKSVRAFAKDIQETESKIDILINNAGLGFDTDQLTEDGVLRISQVNHFGPFLLTHLLINLLKNAAPSRIVSVSSCFNITSNLHPEELALLPNRNSILGKMITYGNTKMAVLLASDTFAEKLAGSGVTSNAIHPGIVKTPIFGKIVDNQPGIGMQILSFTILNPYRHIIAKDVWHGSQTSTHVAITKSLEKVTGKYFADCTPFFKPMRASKRKILGKEMWKISEEIVGLRDDEKL